MVVEVEPFASRAEEVWDDDEKTEFIGYLACNPEAGTIMSGSGGLRKIRWGRRGVGKRGGVRVIYYFHDDTMPLFLLGFFSKSRKTDLTKDEQRRMTKLTKALRSEYGQE